LPGFFPAGVISFGARFPFRVLSISLFSKMLHLKLEFSAKKILFDEDCQKDFLPLRVWKIF